MMAEFQFYQKIESGIGNRQGAVGSLHAVLSRKGRLNLETLYNISIVLQSYSAAQEPSVGNVL